MNDGGDESGGGSGNSPQHLSYENEPSFYKENHTSPNKRRHPNSSGWFCFRRCQAIYVLFCSNERAIPKSNSHEYAGEEFYVDEKDIDDHPRSCSCGTSEDDGIWMNRGDYGGWLMSSMVWSGIVYVCWTVTCLSATATQNNVSTVVSVMHVTICGLALASHLKTTLTDPGSVPLSALPYKPQSAHLHQTYHPMCSICKAYKPPQSHHCRICNRCISGMDHHCPWMNNCIGANNTKHFILFLVYTWTGSLLSLAIFGYHYLFLQHYIRQPLITLVPLMTIICFAAFQFTTNMLINVSIGMKTGLGTIDRMQVQRDNNYDKYKHHKPIPYSRIFGIGHIFTWLIPTDPIFPNYDAAMGYSTPSRLVRESRTYLNDPQQQNTHSRDDIYSFAQV